MSNERVIDRIRKLLELSRSTNEHEAASAAAKASQLMREHEIGEAMLRATDSERYRAEPIVDGQVTGTKVEGKRVAWKCFIASGAADAFGVHQFTMGGMIKGMGRTSAVQTWDYTCQYLYREVDRLADEAWFGPAGELPRWNDVSPRAWKNAFRVGAASVISKRLRAQAAEQNAHKRADVAAIAALAGPDTANQTGHETMAIAVIDRDRAELDAAYETRAKKFGKATALGSTSSRSGLMAGREAGSTVNLTGGGRGLPAPAKAIKG